MKITQVTHHDLDGYGAATVVRAHADVERIVHVSRYTDVGPVVAGELVRLKRTEEPEMLLVTDLGLEAPTVAFIRDFVGMNTRRGDGRHHRLLVLDHHASSLGQLTAGGFDSVEPREPLRPSLSSVATGDGSVTVLVDDDRCATRLAYDHAALYAAAEPAPAIATALAALVEAIDTVDLWRKDQPLFRQAQALDEVFWDNVSGYIPLGHPFHDRFIGDLLLGMAARLGGGATSAEVERAAEAIRARIVDDLLSDRPEDDPDATTRMRLAPLLADSPELFVQLDGGAKLSFGLEAGMFQRTSDAILTRGDAALVINVGRSGSMSFRSNDGSALDAARKFRGGGHRDAAGGRLLAGAVASLKEAIDQVSAVLRPQAATVTDGPFAALRGFKA